MRIDSHSIGAGRERERETVRDNKTVRRTEGLSVVIHTTPLQLWVLSAVPRRSKTGTGWLRVSSIIAQPPG